MNKKLYTFFVILFSLISLLSCSSNKPYQLNDNSSYTVGMTTVLSIEDIELTKENIQQINFYLEEYQKVDKPEIKATSYYYSSISIFENNTKSIIIYGEYIYIVNDDSYYQTTIDLYNYLEQLLKQKA